MKKKLLLLTLVLLGLNLSFGQFNKVFYNDEDNREIRIMNLDGSDDTVFFKQTETLYPRYLAANSATQELFFTTSSPYKIYKKNFNGTLEQEIYTSPGPTIYNIAIDETNAKIYWVEYQEIKRSNLDGSNVETIIGLTADVYIRNIAISGTEMFWAERFYNTGDFSNTYYLKKSNLDGSGVTTIHTEYVASGGTVTQIGTVYGLQVDSINNHLYWASSSADAILRKNTDGSGGVTTVLNNTYVLTPRSLAVDAANNKLYWTDTSSTFDNVRSANLDGTGVVVHNNTVDDPYGITLATVNASPAGVPEIDIQGNNLSISNNDTTPDSSDNTDFGDVALNNNYKDHYFFIRNLGGTVLNISGPPSVSITGANASDFTLQTDANSSINGVSNSYFVIRFDPSVLGLRTATVTVNSNDSDEAAYTFNIQGNGNVSSGETGTNDIRITTHATGGSLDNEDPDIAYDPTLDRYLVVFEKEIINSDEEVFGQFISNTGALIGGEFRISITGPESNIDHDAADPKIVFNTVSNQYMVVWRADDVTNGENEVYGQLINPDGTLVNGLGNDIRISQNGTDGDTTAYVSTPEVTFNSTNGEYLVVWQANATSNVSDYNIYGQRISSAGVLVGGLGGDFQISQNGSSTQYSSVPDVAYNPTTNQYMVAYHADLPNNGDNNIWSRVVNADGTLSTLTQITNVGGSRDADYARVEYNPLSNEFIIVYQTDHVNTDNEDEIFGQRVSNAGVLIGSEFQVSFAGIDGDGEETGSYSDVYYNPTHQQILVTFQSEEPGSNAYDIFATTLDAANYALLETQSRVSDMGDSNGDNTFLAQKPKQAYNSTNGTFFIVWEGDDTVPGDGEDEIFGQRWQSPPTTEIEIQGNSIVINDGDTTPDASDNTNFGQAELGSTIVKSFTVLNTNTEQLVLNGTPTISISGANAADFSVTAAPATAIDPGNSTTFDITFSASTLGVRTASISIENNDAGENPYNFDIMAESIVPLNIEENNLLKSQLLVYPNPNKGVFTLSYAGNETLKQVVITDVTGKKIETISLNNFIDEQEINLNNLSKGIYFATVFSSNNKATKKLVIN